MMPRRAFFDLEETPWDQQPQGSRVIVGQIKKNPWLSWMCNWKGHPKSAAYDAFGWHGIQCPRCGLVFLHETGRWA